MPSTPTQKQELEAQIVYLRGQINQIIADLKLRESIPNFQEVTRAALELLQSSQEFVDLGDFELAKFCIKVIEIGINKIYGNSFSYREIIENLPILFQGLK